MRKTRRFQIKAATAVIAAALLPVFTYIFRAFVEHQTSGVVWFCPAMAILIAAILIIKHIPNIKRIGNGKQTVLRREKIRALWVFHMKKTAERVTG